MGAKAAFKAIISDFEVRKTSSRGFEACFID